MSTNKNNTPDISKNVVKESQPVYGFVTKSPEEKILDLVNRSDMEKLHAFTRMLKRNATLKKAIVLPSQKDSTL
ncbi:MAG: hypothetical protein IBJ16_05860 [Chitinophagaceae bacterium]|nr:hypothetical protein [Chitinophagaceae bacterium]